MRSFLFFVCLGFCPFFWAQFSKSEITADLPKNFKYKYETGDFFKRGPFVKSNVSDSIYLGCASEDVARLGLEFTFSIRHKKRKNKETLFLFAVKRKDYRTDELIINALDMNCYAGQSNYYFLSNDYILFTYTGSGDALAYKFLDEITKIEMQLVDNLNKKKIR